MRKADNLVQLGTDGKIPSYFLPSPTKLDFLFVDAWVDYNKEEYYTPDVLLLGMSQLSISDNSIFLGVYTDGDFYIKSGTYSDPFVPLSQTTIFIHPTTKVPYLFNGTIMVEYSLEYGVTYLNQDGIPYIFNGTELIRTFKPELDFLLVDYWVDDSSWLPQGIMDAETAIFNRSTGIGLGRLSGGDELYSFGYGSVPFVPISQTTIFIHPTTFQRYMFNGTTMIEYDDVDGIVPKWLKYEALLTQSGTDAPVARVLNQDERDFWSGISMNKLVDGENVAAIIDLRKPISSKLVHFNPSVVNGVPSLYLMILAEGFFEGNTCMIIDGIGNVGMYESPISIKQRVRGNPPKLISAETNTVGDKVIITYNKKLNPSLDLSSFMNDILTSGIFIEGFPEGQSFIGIQSYLIIENSVELTLVSNIPYTLNNMSMSRNNFIIESLDYGINNDGWDVAVTNNVPEDFWAGQDIYVTSENSIAFKDSLINGYDFGGKTLHYVDFPSYLISGYDNVNLTNVSFYDSYFSTTFNNIDLTGCWLVSGTHMGACSFNSGVLNGMLFNGAYVGSGMFNNVTINNTSFFATTFTAISFVDTSLVDTDFSYADLSMCSLSNCNLTGAIFTGTKVNNTNFSGSIGLDWDINVALSGVNKEPLGVSEPWTLVWTNGIQYSWNPGLSQFV